MGSKFPFAAVDFHKIQQSTWFDSSSFPIAAVRLLLTKD